VTDSITEVSRVDHEVRVAVLMLVRGMLGGKGQVVNPGYKEIFDVLDGMECRCRRTMRMVLALLLSQARSGNCECTSCVESGYD
jgi:hypothetical protein